MAKSKKNRNKKKKAQVTLFLIIGIILVVIIGITFYITGQSKQKQGEENLKTQQQTQTLIQPVKEYVTDCLKFVSGEGLVLLGEQGGRIYKTQDGIIDDFAESKLGTEYIIWDKHKVPYAILKPTGQVGTSFYSEPPRYPFDTFPVIKTLDGKLIQEEYLEGYYGKENLPQLFPPAPNSVQQQLKHYIETKITDCVDWQQFQQKGLAIKIGNPNATVNIQNKSIYFMINWPLTITSEASKTTAKIEEFTVSYPVKFPQLYTVLNYAVSQDITNINFTLDNYQAGPITARIYRDIYINDDIVIFEDTSSKIIDKTFKFIIARQDRSPALYYIDPDEVLATRFCNGTTISRTNTSIYIDNSCGTDLNITLESKDPDEDEVEYTFNLPYLNNWESHTLTQLEAQRGSYGITVTVRAHGLLDYQDVTILTRRG